MPAKALNYKYICKSQILLFGEEKMTIRPDNNSKKILITSIFPFSNIVFKIIIPKNC